MASASASTATATTCATTTAHWGSLTKSLSRMTPAPITNIRGGRTACFDRMAVDIRGNGAGDTVRYVSQVLSQGRGSVVPLRGGARLPMRVFILDGPGTGSRVVIDVAHHW